MTDFFGEEISLIVQERDILRRVLGEAHTEKKILESEENMLEFLMKQSKRMHQELESMKEAFLEIQGNMSQGWVKNQSNIEKLIGDFKKYCNFAYTFGVVFMRYEEIIRRDVGHRGNLLRLEEIFRREVEAVNKVENTLSKNLFGQEYSIVEEARENKLLDMFRQRFSLYR